MVWRIVLCLCDLDFGVWMEMSWNKGVVGGWRPFWCNVVLGPCGVRAGRQCGIKDGEAKPRKSTTRRKRSDLVTRKTNLWRRFPYANLPHPSAVKQAIGTSFMCAGQTMGDLAYTSTYYGSWKVHMYTACARGRISRLPTSHREKKSRGGIKWTDIPH